MTNTRSITEDSAHVRQNCMQDPLRPKAAPPALHAVPPSILLTLRGTVGSGSYLEQGSETELGLKCQRRAGLTQQNYSGTMAQTCSTKGLSNQGSVCSARSRQHAQGNPCEQGLREIPLQASAEYVSDESIVRATLARIQYVSSSLLSVSIRVRVTVLPVNLSLS